MTPAQQGPESPAPAPIVVPHQQQAPPSPASATAERDHGQHNNDRDAAANEAEPVRTYAVPEGADVAGPPGSGVQGLVDAGEMAGGVGAEAAAVPAGPGAGLVDEELLEDAAKAADDIAIVVRR